MSERFLSTTAAAARLGVARDTLYAYVSRGRLQAHRRTGHRGSWFDPVEIDALVRKARAPSERQPDLRMFPWKDAPFIDRSNGGSGRQWPLSLKKALDTVKNVQSVIGGHQPVATWKDFATFQQFTAELWSQTEAAQKAGKSVDEAAASTGWLSKYPGYDSTRLKAAVQAIYDELSGK